MIQKPTWCYKRIYNVPHVSEIQSELLGFMVKIKPNISEWNTDVVYLPKDKIVGNLPLYENYLKSINVFDRWHYSLLVYNNNGEKLPIHVDSTNWEGRCYALNMPALNCQNTYTVWYDAEIDDSVENSQSTNDKYVDIRSDNLKSTARIIKNGAVATEIDRLETDSPAWINYTIPHTGLCYHNNPRAMFSSRFNPELHDIIDTL